MDRVRWAVIVAGGIARRRTIPEGIVPAANAELVAVYSPQSGADVAKQFGVHAADSEDSLFDFDFDALYVASPVDCHLRQVLRAAEENRHVLCEKPLALDAGEAEDMVAACDRRSVLLGTAFMMRFHPLHQGMARHVQGGKVGRPVYARAQLACWYPPLADAWRQNPARSGGGVLLDLAPHCIDLLEMVLGSTVIAATCRSAQLVHDYPVEDTAVILLEFENGALATVDCMFNTPDDSCTNRLEIYGSSGSLLAEHTLGQTCDGQLELRPPGEQLPRADRSANLYRDQIESFSRAILRREPPLTCGRQGLHIQQIIDACYESVASGRRVTCSETRALDVDLR
jgi:predicted dehydrogenase